VDILSEYGEVKMYGSYVLDLMLRPDLDIRVVAEKHDWDKLLEVQSKLTNTKYFRNLCFANWLDFEHKRIGQIKEWVPDINGYYFSAVVPLEDQRWKLDIWLVTKENDVLSRANDKFKVLLNELGERAR